MNGGAILFIVLIILGLLAAGGYLLYVYLNSTKIACDPNCKSPDTCNDDGSCACSTVGYTGLDCKTPPTPPTPTPTPTDDSQTSICEPRCQNGGVCQNKVCVCKKGFTGAQCQTPDMDCPKPCINGTCDRTIGTCKCPVGYAGLDCSINATPCQNNAKNRADGSCNCSTATSGPNGKGWVGIACQIPVKDCGTNQQQDPIDGTCKCYGDFGPPGDCTKKWLTRNLLTEDCWYYNSDRTCRELDPRTGTRIIGTKGGPNGDEDATSKYIGGGGCYTSAANGCACRTGVNRVLCEVKGWLPPDQGNETCSNTDNYSGSCH